MPINKNTNSLPRSHRGPKISTAKCSFCSERLSTELTTKEVTMQFPNGYHPECYRMFKRQTRSLSGVFASMLSNARERAEKMGWDYDLDAGGFDDTEGIEFLMSLYRRQKGRCALTEMEFLPNNDPEWKFHRTPSLDRIDSNGGYTRDNVQIVIQAAQYRKSSMTDDQLLEISQAIVDTAKLKKKPATRKRTARIVASSSKATKPRDNDRGRRAAV